jgi:diaminopimelate decarboxylase
MEEAARYDYRLHYAVKANAHPRILSLIAQSGMGADCVSGGEIRAALKAGFPCSQIVFAGVGKADWEIDLGLDKKIFCFNAESLPELEVINDRAGRKRKTARIALRINPEIDAHTHQHITTGTKENKFGIALEQLPAVLKCLPSLTNLQLIGIHFHIGSQITDMEPFEQLCLRAKEIEALFLQHGISLPVINFGGGLGIDYEDPNRHPLPNFRTYFKTFRAHFPSTEQKKIHFELGRSIVGQCGNLMSKVLYVKEGSTKKFVVLDAGFTDLIRPALYGAYHTIENTVSSGTEELYDVVGPICESSDCFARDILLPYTCRGQLLAIRSAGAYGQVMASQYNCRPLPGSYFI